MAKVKLLEPEQFGTDNFEIESDKFHINTNYVERIGVYGRIGNKFDGSAPAIANPDAIVWFVFSISKAGLSPYYIASDGEVYHNLSIITAQKRDETYIVTEGNRWKPRKLKIRKTKRKNHPNLLDKVIITGFIRNEFGGGNKIDVEA